jgi:tetratricopeptide (TPR) repeat protein
MSSEKQIFRNDPCPCGSGHKYKKCCGNLAHHSGFRGVSENATTTPSQVEQLLVDAERLRTAGNYEVAKQKYEEILRVSTREARAVTGLGLCLTQLGQGDRGLEELRRAIDLAPDELACLNHLIVALFNRGKVEESLKWSKRAVRLGPEGAKTNVLLANCYEKLHRIEEALEANRLAQIANPQIKYLKLQEAKLNARNGDYDRAKNILRETIQVPGLDPEVRTQMLSELGRVLDKLNNYGEAYDVFAQGGLESSRNPKVQKFKLETRPNLIKAYIKGLTEERLKKWKPEDLKDDSWTRIVGANPDIGWMADQLDVETILQLRSFYRKKVEADQETPIGSKIIIDKLPLNIMHIGLINLVFPDAKIIVALRDPRDSCLSCFMQEFKLNSAMIHFLTLDRAAHFYTQVMGAWLHFRDIITLSHLAIRYEDTVQNLEFEAKRLFDYLGLDWEPEVLQFHQHAANRVISTPSYAAVTEPVYTRAVGRWKNYHKQFTPLLSKLEPFLNEFGYEVDCSR